MNAFALALDGSTLYVSGTFSALGGQPRANLAALDATTGLATAWNAPLQRTASVLVATPGALYVGGMTTAVAGGAPPNLFALDKVTGQPLPWGPGAGNDVRTIVTDGVRMFVGGSFSLVGGFARRNLAAFDLNTGEALPWNPGTNGAVTRLVSGDHAEGRRIYITGPFYDVDGQTRNGLAAVDAATGALSSWNPAPVGTVEALATSDSTVYAGGYFGEIGGQPRHFLAALDATSALLRPWNPQPSGPVLCLAKSGPTLYAGGEFTVVGATDVSGIAAIDEVSGIAQPWSLGFDRVAGALLPVGERIAVGFSGPSVSDPRYFDTLDSTTGASMSPTAYLDGSLRALEHDGDRLYLGGSFLQVGDEPRARLAAFDLSTGLLTDWNPAASAEVFALARFGPAIYAGGAFLTIGGALQPGLAALVPEAGPPAAQVVFPNGPSPLGIGGPAVLTWSASDDLEVESVNLWLSRSGPEGPWELIAGAAPNTGQYTWTVTGPAVPALAAGEAALLGGGDAYLRVEVQDYAGNVTNDVSDAGFAIVEGLVDVAPEPGPSALAFAFAAPTPNPVTARAQLTYTLPARGPVRLALHDVRGREVAVLAEGERDAGRHVATLDARGLGAGLYFARLTTVHGELARRVVVLQ